LADTLEQHGGFAEVVASLCEGHGGTIGGTWGSASALTAAAVANQLAASPRGEDAVLVVVLPHAGDADAFCDDLSLFTTRPVALLPDYLCNVVELAVRKAGFDVLYYRTDELLEPDPAAIVRELEASAVES
jgi:hypothetical protein